MRRIVAFVFAVASLVIVTRAGAEASKKPLSWLPQTYSPQRGFGAEAEALYRSCGAMDLGLVRIAGRVVARRAAGRRALSGQELKEIGTVEGVPQPWLRAWSLLGKRSASEVESALQTWLGARRGQARCGVARGMTQKGEPVVAVAVVDALADLEPLHRSQRRFAWVSLRARVHVPARAAKVILLGPRGEPKSVLASLHAGQVRSRFRLDQPGRWLVQLLAMGSSGPLPVAEATLFVDSTPPKHLPLPPPSAAKSIRAPANHLLRLLNRERLAEGRAPLRRSSALDAVARLHAEEMMRVGRVAHDLGRGGPHARVAAAGLRVRTLGENVAQASHVPAIHRALWSSPSHRQNMLAAVYLQVGVAVVRDRAGRLWAVELFAR